MKYQNILPVTLAVAAVASAPAQALVTARSVPPASFLDYHVDTVPQLTFEVTYDKTVQARLAHHFHLTGPAMGAYVRDNLVLRHLSAPLRTRVYCVSPRGREYFVLMTLKAGTPVFAQRRTGRPVLRLVCGNPLVSALPPAPKQKTLADKSGAKRAPKALARTPAKASVKSAPVVRVAPDLASVDVAPAATTSAPDGTLFTRGASSASGAGWLALLPVLAGVFMLHPGSGGGSGQDVSGGTPGASPSPFTPSSTSTSTTLPTTFTTPTTTPTSTFTTPTSTPTSTFTTPTSTPTSTFTTPTSTPTSTTTPISTMTPITLTPPVSGGPSLTTPNATPQGGPAPAPEPGPVCVFALGGLTLGLLRLRRRR